MKHAVSVSMGSSKRDKCIEINLLGEPMIIERIGTDGDMERAAELFQELDGKVDAFGVGGADLGLMVENNWYPLHSVKPMVRHIRKTPFVDGLGLKNTLERDIANFLEAKIGDQIQPRHVLFTAGADRWGMSLGFVAAGYRCVFGDLMFGLDIPIPVRSIPALKRVAAVVMPIAGRLPFSMLYPTGDKQDTIVPKHEKWYQWATVLAGDCHYIKGSMPTRLEEKIVVTNTTTPRDVELFRDRGVGYLVTTTPVIDNRSFGTNMMEAALVALAGKGRKLTTEELTAMINELGFEPHIQDLRS